VVQSLLLFNIMLVREHPELVPWPDYSALSGTEPLAKPEEVLRFRILKVMVTNPATIHLTLIYGRRTCSWSKALKDADVGAAFRKNRDNLVGKTLQEVGNLDII
jgi:hypothetical protein